MRASLRKAHVSGAERLIDGACLKEVLEEMLRRALASYALPDEIRISADTVLPDSIACIRSLDVKTRIFSTIDAAHRAAKEILGANGISPVAIENARRLLQSGPTPEGTNMRGAMIIDALTGERIEPDIRRGVRVSRIDYTQEARMFLKNRLTEFGIYHERVIDALAIASKVIHRNETVAELCCSDNPDYTTGYVASKKSGYVRLAPVKEEGSLRGGRAFFVDARNLHLGSYIDYLEKQPVIIDRIGDICEPLT